MPGVFLTSVPDLEPNELPQKEKFRLAQLYKSKWLYVIYPLVLLCFVDWNGSSAEIVDLPTKHPDFIGRRQELEELEKRLLAKQRGRDTNVVSLYGEGGIGKTELAISFANSHLGDFSMIAWIDGSSEESLVHSYAKLGDYLNIKDENPAKRRERIHWNLENNMGKPWLLIFDDLSELPFEFPKRGGAILITCRDKGLFPSQSSFELSKNHEEALLLLSNLTGQNSSEQLTVLAEQLDYLPLMINLAGHYIAATPGVNVSSYSAVLTEIMETSDSPLKWEDIRNSKSLHASYLTTLQLLQKKHPLSFEFLTQAAVLHTNSIPYEFLMFWLKYKNQFTEAQINLLMGDILRELKNHSLIRYDDNKSAFSIHQLLHHALSLSEEKDFNAKVWLKILSNHIDVKKYNPTHKNSIRPFQKILPHAIKIIDHISIADTQGVHLALIVARYFIETDVQLQKGNFYLDKAQRWTDNWDHPIKGRIAFMQAMSKYREAESFDEENGKKRNFQESLDYFNKALDIFLIQNRDELYVGLEQNPSKCTKEYQRAICMQFQGQILRILGQVEEAENKLDESMIAFLKLTHGKDHFDIARIMREQAIIMWDKGEHEAAIAKMENAILMQKRVYGENYLFQPTVADVHRILGDFYYKKGEYQKAVQAYDIAIQVTQTIHQTIYQNNPKPHLGNKESEYQKGERVYATQMNNSSDARPDLENLFHLKAKAQSEQKVKVHQE